MTKPAGRPHNVNRQAALVLGDKTYSGKRCKRCGTAEKYTRGSGCVQCQKVNAIEARQLLRAARKGVKPNSGAKRPVKQDSDDLSFLDGVTKLTKNSHHAHVETPSCSAKLTNSPLFTSSEIITEGVIAGESENACFGELVSTPTVGDRSDPEPICPQCECGVEADWATQPNGWLQRTSPWRCTICDWRDTKAPPANPVDTDDFLG